MEDDLGLLNAETVDDLHLLLTGGMGLAPRQRTIHEAEQALRRHHPEGRDAVTTARLLVTDRRWDRLTDQLLAALVATGLLGKDELDGLALDLLAAERLKVLLDGRLFEGGLVVTIEEDGSLGPVRQEAARPEPEPVHVGRTVPPQLRRWAARRATTRSLLSATEVRALLRMLPSQDRGAGMLGILDAYHALAALDRTDVLDDLLVHGDGRVRQAALLRLVEAGGRERAEWLATEDRDARVRATFARHPAQPETLF